MPNNTLNTTELMSGKDGGLFVTVGDKTTYLAELSGYSVTMNFSSVERQPVGSITIYSVPTGVSYALTCTQMLIRDDVIMEPLLEAVKNGQIPVFHFQTKVEKPDGQEQRIALNNCVPNGNFNLLNITPGEIIEQEMNFTINSRPEYLSKLASTYLK